MRIGGWRAGIKDSMRGPIVENPFSGNMFLFVHTLLIQRFIHSIVTNKNIYLHAGFGPTNDTYTYLNMNKNFLNICVETKIYYHGVLVTQAFTNSFGLLIALF